MWALPRETPLQGFAREGFLRGWLQIQDAPIPDDNDRHKKGCPEKEGVWAIGARSLGNDAFSLGAAC